MGGLTWQWYLERERQRQQRHATLLPPPMLDLDPTTLALLDRIGNRGMLRLFGNPAPTPTTTGTTTPPTVPEPSTQEPAPAPDVSPSPDVKPTEEKEDVAPPQLALANPYANTYALSTDYALTSHLLGLGFNALSRKAGAPFENEGAGKWLLNPLVRVGLATPLVLAQIAAMTYSHEMDHFRVDTEAGGSPVITFPRDAWYAIWTGLTTRNANPARPFTLSEEILTEVAGVNAEHFNADYLFWDAARREGGLSQAAGYFLARSNTFFYSALLPLFKGVTNMDDIDQYRTDVAEHYRTNRGILNYDLSRDTISWGSGLTALFSSGTLGAFRSLGRYIATGESRFNIPMSKFGGLEFTWPDFHYLLTEDGPVIGGQALFAPHGRNPVGMTFDVRPGSSGLAFKFQIYDLKLGKKAGVRFNPFGSVSADVRLGSALKLGSDVRIVFPGGWQVIATPSYTFGTHLLDLERGVAGFEFNASIGLPFR